LLPESKRVTALPALKAALGQNGKQSKPPKSRRGAPKSQHPN
jgi:hypothetical protein